MDCTEQLQKHISFLSVHFCVKNPVSSCLTFGLLAGASFYVHPHSASHAWGWLDSTLGRDAERAPCTPPSPAMGLAFGAPYKKASFLCVSRWETLRPYFLYLWPLALLGPLQPPWGEGALCAGFCRPGVVQPHRGRLYICGTPAR